MQYRLFRPHSASPPPVGTKSFHSVLFLRRRRLIKILSPFGLLRRLISVPI